MDQLDFNPTDFAFSLPVWICAQKSDHEVPLGGKLEGDHKFTSFFTDEDLAMRCILALGAEAELEPVQIPDAEALAGVLVALQRAGYSHVVFDGTGKTGGSQVGIEIAGLLRMVKG